MDEAIARARTLVGVSRYYRDATLEMAPLVVNCITLWQWVVVEAYDLLLPERLLSLEHSVAQNELRAGDIVLTPQCPAWNGEDDWGHCGVLTHEGTVIHATRRRRKGNLVDGVREDLFRRFLWRGFLAARRLTFR